VPLKIALVSSSFYESNEVTFYIQLHNNTNDTMIFVYRRRTDNAMTERKSTKGQTTSTKHTHKTKDRVARTPLKTGGELGCSGRVSSSSSTYISQLIRYSRACGSHQDFLDRGLLLTMKLLNQGFLLFKLRSSVRKFYGRHHNLVECYGTYEWKVHDGKIDP
jgi:hypothetical protein